MSGRHPPVPWVYGHDPSSVRSLGSHRYLVFHLGSLQKSLLVVGRTPFPLRYLVVTGGGVSPLRLLRYSEGVRPSFPVEVRVSCVGRARRVPGSISVDVPSPGHPK